MRSIYVNKSVMKTIITLTFIFFISFAAQAQTATEEVKVETIKTEVILETTTEVVRLYKRSNSRVKTALKFTTKRNAAKKA